MFIRVGIIPKVTSHTWRALLHSPTHTAPRQSAQSCQIHPRSSSPTTCCFAAARAPSPHPTHVLLLPHRVASSLQRRAARAQSSSWLCLSSRSQRLEAPRVLVEGRPAIPGQCRSGKIDPNSEPLEVWTSASERCIFSTCPRREGRKFTKSGFVSAVSPAFPVAVNLSCGGQGLQGRIATNNRPQNWRYIPSLRVRAHFRTGCVARRLDWCVSGGCRHAALVRVILRHCFSARS
jgi:hypothetical protein